ncbi:MAG TPA: xanthine dehydrogenase family protein molybdopterin-binding subunit [Bacillota bacterium]
MTAVGSRVRQAQHVRWLRGQGRYVADVRPPGVLEAVIVRSPHAHARIRAVDPEAARSAPGVVAVLTAADLPRDLGPIPLRLGARVPHGHGLQPVLAGDRVRYVGEPVAVVVAADRYAAEDAAERLRVDYEPLPVVVSAAAALAEGAPVLHPELGHNLASAFTQESGDVEAGLRAAERIVEASLSVARNSAVPMETRGLVADYDAATRRLTVWGPTKVVHFNRDVLARLLGWPPEQIRFIEPDVGGGFGARGEFYPEDFLIPYLAWRLGRPVAWIEDRREHLTAINHSREQHYRVRAGVDGDGRITALDVEILCDNGAYLRTHGVVVADLGSALLPGPYRIPHYRARVRVALTNKTPMGTFRGPGRYEGTFARERLIDLIAREVDLDPAEVRRRNLLRPGDLPYDAGTVGLGVPTIYDSGDPPKLLEAVLKAVDYEGVRRQQALQRAGDDGVVSGSPTLTVAAHGGAQRDTTSGAAQRGIARGIARPGTTRLGVGLAAFVEKSGTGPWEYARVEIDDQGRVLLRTGAAELGQGITTALRQVVADQLGLAADAIDVIHGDTDQVPRGMGSWASRSMVVAGSAALGAARRLREQALQVAAELLEAAPHDLEVVAGGVGVRGAAQRFVPWSQLAGRGGQDGRLVAEHVFEVEHMTYPFGVHAAVVAVDVETGRVEVLRYVIAHDAGRVINPMIVEGQLLGGLGQGVGGALLEELVYDDRGQLLSGSFMDYLLPTAGEVPIDVRLIVSEDTPTPLNPLGVKGVGEGGCTGAGAAVANAVADALGKAPVDRLPLTPHTVWRWGARAVGARSTGP